MTKLFLCFLTFIVSLTITANIYEYQDDKGKRVYSDRAPITSPASLRPTTPTNNYQIRQHTAPTTFTGTPQSAVSYDLQFKTPQDQQTFKSPAEIPVVIQVTPQLPPGFTVQLLTDGTLQQQCSTQTCFLLKDLPRGAHSLSIQLLNQHHQVIKTSRTITIFVHQSVTHQDNLT